MSFVFFDTETTGLRLGFDQIVHFAAVRTDAELKVVDQFEARSKLLPQVVPHPSALRTNRLFIGQLTDSALPSHYEMVGTIRKRLASWSPSIFVGYNSIRFDEEMLRHALFQTLHPPYLTSNYGNCRADVLSLVMAAGAVTPACLSVPVSPEGRPTFRLELLAAANGIAQDKAHDAMSDVLATLNLCRCVYERASDLWQRFVRFSKKATVADFVDSEDGFFLTEFFSNEAYHSPVVCVGTDPEQSNGRLCLRLDGDINQLIAMADADLQLELQKKPNPIRRLRVNAAPTLTAFYDAPDKILNGCTLDEIEAVARRIKGDNALCARLVSAYVANREPRPPARYVEERIYEGFADPPDEMRMEAFHDANWSEALSIVESLDDERLKTFGRRLIYLGHRSILPDDIRADIERQLTGHLIDEEASTYTLTAALRDTEKLLEEQGYETILADYRAYLVQRIERVSGFRRTLPTEVHNSRPEQPE